MTCRDVVELVTEHLERALADEDERRVRVHLDECGDCFRYVDQMRVTRHLLSLLFG
jgi:Putative zinc-finger